MCNSALSVGITRDDILEMGWGELILTLQAYAKSSEVDDGPREATWAEITAWAGAPM